MGQAGGGGGGERWNKMEEGERRMEARVEGDKWRRKQERIRGG